MKTMFRLLPVCLLVLAGSAAHAEGFDTDLGKAGAQVREIIAQARAHTYSAPASAVMVSCSVGGGS